MSKEKGKEDHSALPPHVNLGRVEVIDELLGKERVKSFDITWNQAASPGPGTLLTPITYHRMHESAPVNKS